MSHGLQVFSATGKNLLDTTRGGMPVLDYVQLIAASDYAWTKSYPTLVGHELHYELLPRGASAWYADGYPIVTVTYPGGVPTVTVTKGGTSALYDWSLVVFARASGNPLDSYGLLTVSSLDQKQVIIENTRSLRFRGVVSPFSHYLNPSTGAVSYYWYLGQQGILAAGENRPYVFLEISPTYYAALTYTDQLSYGGSTEWYVGALGQSTAFMPRLVVFSDDMAAQPVTDSSYGLAIYDSTGALQFHSGRDNKSLQHVGIHPVTTPAYGQSFLVGATPELPPICASSYISTVYNLVGPDVVYYTALKRSGNDVIVSWIIGHNGYELAMPQSPKASFIDVSHYL